IVLRARHQVHGEEPFHQRRARFVEESCRLGPPSAGGTPCTERGASAHNNCTSFRHTSGTQSHPANASPRGRRGISPPFRSGGETHPSSIPSETALRCAPPPPPKIVSPSSNISPLWRNYRTPRGYQVGFWHVLAPY